MNCNNCGAQLDKDTSFCPQCGNEVAQPNQAQAQPPQQDQANAAPPPQPEYTAAPPPPPPPNYGAAPPPPPPYGAPPPVYGTAPVPPPPGYEQKSKLVAGLLGIFVGGLGIHNFYLGYTTKGVIQIILSVVTCGLAGIWGFIEGILILVGNINVDANNVPLKD